MQARQHANAMSDKCNKQNPPSLEDQKQLNRYNRIDHKEGVGNACKNLWPCEGHKECITLKFVFHRALRIIIANALNY